MNTVLNVENLVYTKFKFHVNSSLLVKESSLTSFFKCFFIFQWAAQFELIISNQCNFQTLPFKTQYDLSTTEMAIYMFT